MTAACKIQHAPTEAQVLCEQIHEIGLQIDRRLGNRAGTAEKGVWFWYWPPHPGVGVEVLTALRRDAVEFLAGITAREKP